MINDLKINLEIIMKIILFLNLRTTSSHKPTPPTHKATPTYPINLHQSHKATPSTP